MSDTAAEAFQAQFERRRKDAEFEAEERKDSQLVDLRLRTYYMSLDPSERVLAAQVLCGWLLSEDESKRFSAEALVSDFNIVEAVPTLSLLGRRLESAKGPGAPYESAKVDRLIAQLTGEGSSNG